MPLEQATLYYIFGHYLLNVLEFDFDNFNLGLYLSRWWN